MGKGILLAFILVFSTGCISQKSSMLTDDICRVSNFGKNNMGIEYWHQEAKKRFDDPYVYACHGSFDQQTQVWYADPDYGLEKRPVADIARELRKKHPNRDIVFIVCNPWGAALPALDRVWYVRSKVWIFPDAYLQYANHQHETLTDFCNVGTIWEFLPAKKTLNPFDLNAHLEADLFNSGE